MLSLDWEQGDLKPWVASTVAQTEGGDLNCGLGWSDSGLPWGGACDGPCSPGHLLKAGVGTRAQQRFPDSLLVPGSPCLGAGVSQSSVWWRSCLEAGKVTAFCPGWLQVPVISPVWWGRWQRHLLVTCFPPRMSFPSRQRGAFPRAVHSLQDGRLASSHWWGQCPRLPRDGAGLVAAAESGLRTGLSARLHPSRQTCF